MWAIGCIRHIVVWYENLSAAFFFWELHTDILVQTVVYQLGIHLITKALDYIYEDRGEVNFSLFLLSSLDNFRYSLLIECWNFPLSQELIKFVNCVYETFSDLGFTNFWNRRVCTGKRLQFFFFFSYLFIFLAFIYLTVMKSLDPNSNL